MAGYGALLNDMGAGLGFDEQSRVTPHVPNARQVGPRYMNMIQAYQQGSPSVYANEAQYEPKYAGLGLENMDVWLNGGNGNPGLIEQMAKANTSMRGSDISDMATLGPGAAAAYRGLNPGGSNLMDLLTKSASEQLGAGASLDPSLKAVTEQSIRGGQAARGLGYGPSDVLEESRSLTSLGDQLRQERQGFGMNVAGANAAYNMPLMSMLSGQSAAPGAAGSEAKTSGPTLFPTTQSYDMFNTLYNAQSASNIAGANNMAASDSASY